MTIGASFWIEHFYLRVIVKHVHNFLFVLLYFYFLEEVTLRGNNVFSRIFKGKTNNSDTCDVCVVDGKSSPIVFSVHRDGMIRAWDFQV